MLHATHAQFKRFLLKPATVPLAPPVEQLPRCFILLCIAAQVSSTQQPLLRPLLGQAGEAAAHLPQALQQAVELCIELGQLRLGTCQLMVGLRLQQQQQR